MSKGVRSCFLKVVRVSKKAMQMSEEQIAVAEQCFRATNKAGLLDLWAEHYQGGQLDSRFHPEYWKQHCHMEQRDLVKFLPLLTIEYIRNACCQIPKKEKSPAEEQAEE